MENLEIADSEKFIAYKLTSSKCWKKLLQEQINVEKQARSHISVLLSKFNKRALILYNGFLKYGNIDAKLTPKYEININNLVDVRCEFQIEKAPYRNQFSYGYYLGRQKNQEIIFQFTFNFKRKHLRYFKKNQSIKDSYFLDEKDEKNLECWIFKGKLDKESQ
ncbi:unnamed protein product (macronuclear) [Paramecium tetraurelia]|uniref:Uncharacterized protein n=1 Tax=Paramecium tetraurelia TaxID=5888 RepID=A0E7S9_PARTE|nr:uncharacterized protein GSPATT00024074001 [Paramecium tetraurelia]CAK91346.1 unnamed protein product [Paramecium tetraurelia]|eukprot:XP_001458743.1 hypothetical protein (macronuclear) [Paramecium tetraurelia strain d4-2]